MTNPKEPKMSKKQPRGEVSTRTEVVSEDPLSNEEAERMATLPEVPCGTSRYKLYIRRFFRNKLATVGVIILGFLTFAALFGNFFAQWVYTEPDSLALSEPPSPEHWFGTNDSGNDLYAQTIHGLGRSLTIAIVVSFATLVISAFVGCAAALWGGFAEKAVLAVIHFLLSIPTFLLIALVVADSGGDWKLLMVVLIAFGWMYQARVIWSLALTVREQD